MKASTNMTALEDCWHISVWTVLTHLSVKGQNVLLLYKTIINLNKLRARDLQVFVHIANHVSTYILWYTCHIVIVRRLPKLMPEWLGHSPNKFTILVTNYRSKESCLLVFVTIRLVSFFGDTFITVQLNNLIGIKVLWHVSNKICSSCTQWLTIVVSSCSEYVHFDIQSSAWI